MYFQSDQSQEILFGEEFAGELFVGELFVGELFVGELLAEEVIGVFAADFHQEFDFLRVLEELLVGVLTVVVALEGL